MSDGSSASTPLPNTAPASARSLRSWGVLIFVMFILTSAVGGSLALEASYLPITLASHIGLALVTLGIAGYTTRIVGRDYNVASRALAGLTAFAALGATVAGTVYLLDGQSNATLYAMEGLGVLGILVAIALIVVGGPSARRATSGPQS